MPRHGHASPPRQSYRWFHYLNRSLAHFQTGRYLSCSALDEFPPGMMSKCQFDIRRRMVYLNRMKKEAIAKRHAAPRPGPRPAP